MWAHLVARNKPMVTTEPAVGSPRLLGLGSKLYPSNIQRMLNKDLSQFMQSLSRQNAEIKQAKGSLCWQGALTTTIT